MGYPDTSAHDAVMNWLQNLELKDHRLGDARSGKVRKMDVTAAIVRMQEKAYAAFPEMERHAIDAFVRKYIDPQNLVPPAEEAHAGGQREE
ncbi:MAG: hypothetical protein IPK99_10165 [Flavobacteriales bacterium]|nr:hypothetical protein [Flavobacteriales bacterium]